MLSFQTSKMTKARAILVLALANAVTREEVKEARALVPLGEQKNIDLTVDISGGFTVCEVKPSAPSADVDPWAMALAAEQTVSDLMAERQDSEAAATVEAIEDAAAEPAEVSAKDTAQMHARNAVRSQMSKPDAPTAAEVKAFRAEAESYAKANGRTKPGRAGTSKVLPTLTVMVRS